MSAQPPAAPTSHPAVSGGVPDWFARGRVARGIRTPSEASATGAASAVSLRPTRRFALWAAGSGLIGYATSLAVHSVVLVTCSLFVLQLGKESGGGTVETVLGVSAGAGDEYLDTRAFDISDGVDGFDEPVSVTEPVPFIDSSSLELAVGTAQVAESAGTADGAGQDDESVEGSGDGDDGAFELPSGGNAVSSGSFAAWTVPEDPRVGQDYIIVVEVALPPQVDKYARSDLSGQLVGTDGYKVNIPDGREWNGQGWVRPMRTPAFRRNGNKARIVFFVRGAQAALVRDTILIRSRLLDEQQKLQIVF